MTITVNNTEEVLEAPCTLKRWVERRLGDKQKGVAVALNGTVVPQAAQYMHILKQNDEILLITATQGG